jgi:hypothetical protein
MLSTALRHRLLLVIGVSTTCSTVMACGGATTTETGQVSGGPAGGQGSQAGSGGDGAGAGGVMASGSSGAAGVGAGAAGSAGASAAAGSGGGGLGGATGVAGAAGAAGTSGAGGSADVPCPPAEDGPTLTCWAGSPIGPSPGCSDDPASQGQKTIGCYAPGTDGAPASPCLTAGDPALPKLLTPPCATVDQITGPPHCRMVQDGTFGAPAAPATPRCCYAAQVQSACQARPFWLGGKLHTAGLVAGGNWSRG